MGNPQGKGSTEKLNVIRGSNYRKLIDMQLTLLLAHQESFTLINKMHSDILKTEVDDIKFSEFKNYCPLSLGARI